MKHHVTERASPPGLARTGPAAEDASPVGGLLSAWDRFWFSPASPTTLALIRALCGALVLYVHLGYSWGLFAYLGPDGWVNDALTDTLRNDQRYGVPGYAWDVPVEAYETGNYWWSFFFHVKSPAWIVVLHVVTLVVMLLFTLGLWSRWTGLLSWVAAMSYIQRAQWTMFGMDSMMMILLAYLMIGPSGATLSLDRLIERWRARRRGQEPAPVRPSVAANFAVRLMQVHFCIIYLASGTSKLQGASWWSGTAPNLVLLNDFFAPFYLAPYAALIAFLAQHRWLWEVVMSAGVVFTLFTEIGLPFLIWDRRWRWVMVCCSALLHTSIGVFMGLVTFSLVMLIMLLSFFPPAVIEQGLALLHERARRARAGPPGPRPGAKPGKLVLTR
jgi:hypothetical protein